jgi:NADPH:quinone reductase-like Zn-dependent oxidoreductase
MSSDDRTTTRAVVFPRFGDADVLEIVDVELPPIEPDRVRVAVRAAGVQPFDARYRAGFFDPYVPAELPQTLGNEFSGVIVAVGTGVTDFAPGDEVLGYVWQAAYAEHVVVGTDEIVPKPDAMPWPEAGGLSASGQTAHTALHELGVEKGETLLIHAAAGGVGHLAVQLAREWGVQVVGTASERNHEYLRGLGAVPVTYGDGLVDRVRAAAPQGIDAVLDAHGGDEAIAASVELVADRKRIGTLSAYAAAQQYGIQLIGTQRSTARLSELTDLYRKGRLQVTVQRTFPLEAVADAHREVETGHVRGKVVLTVGD